MLRVFFCLCVFFLICLIWKQVIHVRDPFDGPIRSQSILLMIKAVHAAVLGPSLSTLYVFVHLVLVTCV